MQQKEHTIWTEKYRPSELSSYVGNALLKETFARYIETQDLPHLLLYSAKPGTGKTTAAKLLAKHIQSEVMYINASYENSVETIRSKIVNFASTVGFEPLKIVILDEADYISPNGQAALRNVMEQFSKNTRFILTCNFVERLIEPVVSRCQVFEVIPPSKKDVAITLGKILKTENITYVTTDIVTIVNRTYPDIRKAIGECQQLSSDGELKIPARMTLQIGYHEKVVAGLKQGLKPDQLRQIIVDSGSTRFEDLYRHLYEKVSEYAGVKEIDVLITIADYQYKDALVPDKEINIAALLCNLYQILHG